VTATFAAVHAATAGPVTPGRPPAVLRTADGAVLALDVDRWRAAPDDLERALLAAVADPVLDVGCGPGRIAAALAADGRAVLGIDPAPGAVAETDRRGAPALCRSVFDPLPGEGRWSTVLLLDGNVGIGGVPLALLRRVAQLLGRGGQAVVEVEPPGRGNEQLTVRVEVDDVVGPWFPWARVGADGWPALAAAVGLVPVGFDVGDGRWFARAVRP
jgi:SAM-dependent methyltransferase